MYCLTLRLPQTFPLRGLCPPLLDQSLRSMTPSLSPLTALRYLSILMLMTPITTFVPACLSVVVHHYPSLVFIVGLMVRAIRLVSDSNASRDLLGRRCRCGEDAGHCIPVAV